MSTELSYFCQWTTSIIRFYITYATIVAQRTNSCKYGWWKENRLHGVPFFRIGICLIVTEWWECYASLHRIFGYLWIELFLYSLMSVGRKSRDGTTQNWRSKQKKKCKHFKHSLSGYTNYFWIFCNAVRITVRGLFDLWHIQIVCRLFLFTHTHAQTLVLTSSYFSRSCDIARFILSKSDRLVRFLTILSTKSSRSRNTFVCNFCVRSSSAGASSEQKIWKLNKEYMQMISMMPHNNFDYFIAIDTDATITTTLHWNVVVYPTTKTAI